MECVVWKSKMELILSEYLISIRVVDYCSLGLLSKNKIKRERVPIGKYFHWCEGVQEEPAHKCWTLTRVKTNVNCRQGVKLDVSNTDFLSSKPAKKAISPNAAACRDLIQDRGVQGFEALGTCRGSSAQGQAKCSMCCPVWAWTRRAATNL